MHLWLNFPASWDLKEAPSDKYLAILSEPGSEPASVPDAIVTYGPISARPDDLRPWMEQTAQSDAPAGTRVRLGTTQELVTHAGWPLHVLQAELVDGKGNVLEARLCAFFLFMEHIAVATVRTRDRARQEALSQELLQILASGRPDWRGEPVCLADLWDLEPLKPAPPRAEARPQPLVDTAELAALLAQMDVELAARPTSREQLRRGRLLLELQRPAEALLDCRAALALDAGSDSAHYLAGMALGALGQHQEAILEWEAARRLNPERNDATYNLGQAYYNLGQYQPALAEFQAAYAADATDPATLRKVIQCLYALGRYDEGEAARALFRQSWEETSDPRFHLINEYVFDQFEGDKVRIHAIETLRPRDPSMYAVLTFAAFDLADQPLSLSVLVETSDIARRAGTPLVLGVKRGDQFKILGTATQLPPYSELKKTVLQLLAS